jgi:ParB family chromosome partitioning protein
MTAITPVVREELTESSTAGEPPAATLAPMKIVTVRVDKIDRRPDQPREHFDKEKLAELATSIAQRGLLQPPVVRRKPGGRYELVAGERRWRAVQSLGWAMMQVKISAQDSDLEAFIDAMTENVVRENMTPMEEARGYGRLRNEGRLTVHEIAARFGKQPTQVSWRLRLLDLVPAAAAAVDAGTVKPYFAGELAQLTPANQTRLLARYARGDFGSETEAIAMVHVVAASEHQEVLFGDADDDTEEARAARERHIRQVDTWFGQLSRLTQILDELAAAEPADLHTGLAGMVAAKIDQLGAVARSVRKAQGKLEAARAIGALNEGGEAASA